MQGEIPPDPPFSKGGTDASAAVVYLLQDGADVPTTDEWLAPAERVQLASLRVPKRRADWRLGRWTAKQAVARALGVRPRRVVIAVADGGAPYVTVDGGAAPCAISISHAGGHGLCAVGPGGLALGCDLETIAERPAVFVRDYFTDGERALVGAAPPAERAAVVTLIWSAKEAALKAVREGLRLDTRWVEVELDGAAAVDGWRRFAVARRDARQRFDGWWRETADLMLTIATPPGSTPPRAASARARPPSSSEV